MASPPPSGGRIRGLSRVSRPSGLRPGVTITIRDGIDTARVAAVTPSDRSAVRRTSASRMTSRSSSPWPFGAQPRTRPHDRGVDGDPRQPSSRNLGARRRWPRGDCGDGGIRTRRGASYNAVMARPGLASLTGCWRCVPWAMPVSGGRTGSRHELQPAGVGALGLDVTRRGAGATSAWRVPRGSPPGDPTPEAGCDAPDNEQSREDVRRR